MRRLGAWLILLLIPCLSREIRAQDAPPGESPAQEMVEHTVRPGETCEDIAQQLYGDGRFYYIVLDALGPLPDILRTTCDRALTPGEVLRLPRRIPAERRPPDARVTAVVRDVRSRAPGTAWREAHQGQRLYRAWRVNTLEESQAELTFRDDSAIQLREETLVIIYGPTAEKARRTSSRAVLERGALKSRLGELRGHRELQVETPSARADLDGGDAVVSVDEENTSHVANHSGRAARVRDAQGGGEVLVRAGMGTRVRPGGRPERPRRLLPAPIWTEGEPEVFVVIRGQPRVVAGSWRSVEGAVRYRVQIAAERDGAEPLASTETPAEVTRFEIRDLPPGVFFVTVSAIDAHGLEGPPSEPRAIRLAVIELDHRGSGGSPPAIGVSGEPPQVPAGTRLAAPEGLRCAVGQAAPAEEIELSEPGRVRLRCHDHQGRQAAAIPLVVVARAEPEPGPPAEGLAGEATGPSTELPEDREAPSPRGGGRTPAEREAEVALAAWHPSEAWGLVSEPNAIGLRDERRPGSQIWVVLGAAGPDRGEGTRLTSLGLRISVLAERLRLELGLPLGAVGHRRGLGVAISTRVLARRRWGLAVGVGLWLPFDRDDDGRYRARLIPTVDLSYAAHERVIIRTRQDVQLDAAEEGAILWASAYGIDWRVIGPFSAALEGSLLLGRFEGELRAAPALSLAVALARGLWSVTLAVRSGLTDDAAELLGRWAVVATVRVGGR